MEASPRARRLTSLGCFLFWGLLAGVELGWAPFGKRMWAMNFWQYYPFFPIPLLLFSASFLFCFDRVRSALLEVLERFRPVSARLGHGLGLFVVLVLVVPAVFWILRERQSFGDSGAMALSLGMGWKFVFPDVGATWVMGMALKMGTALGLTGHASLQAWACLMAAPVLYLLGRLAPELAPGRSVPLVVLLVVSAGLLRTFAGHIEVYSTFLPAALLYLWLALLRLRGRASPLVTRVALGVAIWMHASALFLLPGLIALELLDPRGDDSPMRRAVVAIAQAAVPGGLFLLALAVTGQFDDLGRAWDTAMQMLGRGQGEYVVEWWVRSPGREAGPGTFYVFLDEGHRRYLGNAAFLLAPVGLPLLLVFAIVRPRWLLDSPTGRFLGATTFPLLIYSCLVRPVWGPFDWDLFSLTAVFSTLFAVFLVARALDAATFRWVIFAVVGLQLLFLGLPFVGLGAHAPRPAGPFTQDQFRGDTVWEGNTPSESLAPWL